MASLAEDVGFATSTAATELETALVDAPFVIIALVLWLELECCSLTVELSSLFFPLLSGDLPEADGEREFDVDVWVAVIDGVVGPSRL